ncbi:hypothetical protein SMC26_23850 [Actinomadura fulvescens]|uniref:Uncharacterized protein n=1 Tax=Actinomadura fulvescens TaxID=46160 RepID=A0ABP6CGS4_9ACTN
MTHADQLNALPDATPDGPLDALWAAIRRRVPQVSADRVHQLLPGLQLPDVPEAFIRASYNNGEPRRVVWDDQTAAFAWNSGPDADAVIGTLDDVDRVADTIGRALGANL